MMCNQFASCKEPASYKLVSRFHPPITIFACEAHFDWQADEAKVNDWALTLIDPTDAILVKWRDEHVG